MIGKNKKPKFLETAMFSSIVPVLYDNCDRLDQCFSESQIHAMFKTLQVSKDYLPTIKGEWDRARDMCILAALRYLLLRPNEACGVKFSELNWETNTWWVNPLLNKERKPRVLQIPDKFIEYYKYFTSFPKFLWKNSPYLFPSNQKPKLTATQWGRIFRVKVLIPAGLYETPEAYKRVSRTRSYLLRSTGATEMLDNGEEGWTVAQILGHSDFRTLKNYYFQTKRFKVKQASALNKLT